MPKLELLKGVHETPCAGNRTELIIRSHGRVICADDEEWRPRILGVVPNDHQYGYCEYCFEACRWDTDRQEWVVWWEFYRERRKERRRVIRSLLKMLADLDG